MRISEIFYSIQGEGSRCGSPCAFVRLTGCPLRCCWCDTSYAFAGGDELSIEEILAELEAYPTRLVCVTGGEPLAQAEVHPLMQSLSDAGYTVLLETSGAFDLSEVDPRVIRIMDLKAPGSGEVERNHWANLEELGEEDEIKFVLADRRDYEWALEIIARHRLDTKAPALLFSPVHGVLDPARLAGWILEDGLEVTLQVQLHKILWPSATRGV